MPRIIAALLLTLGLASPVAAKPFVAILADARGTVATDLLAPYAILAESGAVEVKIAAEGRGPVRLTPGYAWVSPQITLAQLERRQPDVLIVPALEVEDDPARAALARSAASHAEAGLRHVASGDYAGEHWLASFAVWMLAQPTPV